MMKHRPIALGLVVALVVLLSLTTVAFADGPTNGTTDNKVTYICVDGFVINHRELPVDGTQWDDPTTPENEGLKVEAVSDKIRGVYAFVDENGYFKFKDQLVPGDWDFVLQLPDEWEGIVPVGEAGTEIATGVTTFDEKDGCYRIVFKIRRLIDIVVVKWEELANGTVRPGEGWIITATPVNDPFVKAQTEETDANGNAGFTLTPGDWIISEKLKKGWTPVTPTSLKLTLGQYDPGGALLPIVFKNRVPTCYGTITVTKYGYGVDDQGDQADLGPLGGWKITLKRADNSMKPVTLVTDAKGQAVFKNLPLGVYTVTEDVQAGWKADKNPITEVVSECRNYPVDFNNIETIGDLTIHGKKLFKAWVPPYKGQLVGLPGWKITATLIGTTQSVDTWTNALGEYRFTQDDLGPLAFGGAAIRVCEEDRDNWIHVTPKCVDVKFPYPVPVNYKGVEVNFTNVQDPPLAGAAAPTTVTAGSCSTYYQVAKGDTLAKIAGRFGVTMKSLIAANGIQNADVIYLGQNLCVK